MLLRTQELEDIVTEGKNKRRITGQANKDNLINKKVVVSI